MKPLNNIYKKIDRCARLLEELNSQVREIRNGNRERGSYGKTAGHEHERHLKMQDAVNTRDEEKDDICSNGDTAAENGKECPEMTADAYDAAEEAVAYGKNGPPEKSRYNTDKTGRTYTEEEIESIIAD